MSWSDTRRIILLVISAGVLTAGCGFRLQGSQTFPPAFAVTYIDTENRYSEFYRGLRAALEQGGVTVSDSVVAADAVIRIEEDTTDQRVLTVSGRNVPTEFDVYYLVTYSVWINGVEALSPRTLTKRQDYTFDSTEVLGKRREEQLLREAIAGELVRQVSQQLSRL